ncbi:MAG: tetratricopeptide repeat protein [Pseudomonadota bacterium]|jgi:hypothetical protein
MNDDPSFYTETMARVYAKQGYDDKALQIYRHLIQKYPKREDLMSAYAQIESRMAQNPEGAKSRLFVRIGEWIDLLFRYRKMKNLKMIKNSFSND